jgi:GT2 family glycosyltransferase
MNKAPIVSFHYKRPDHTLRALKSLSENEGADQSELFIFSDGAKNESEEPLVQEVRRIAKSRLWCGKIHIIERPYNLGLFENITAAITEICNLYSRVIVLEDDSLLSPYFLNYMNNALNKYEDCPEVMHISGYTWPVKTDLPESFFLRIPNVWTWGTWQRAWQHYRVDPTYWLQKIYDQGVAGEISYGGMRPYVQQLEQTLKSKTRNSWAIYWLPAVFFNGLALYPKQSLVQNTGFDGTGVNYQSFTSIYDTVIYQANIVQFPNIIQENKEAKAAFIQYFHDTQPKKTPLLERGLYRFRKKVNSLRSLSAGFLPLQVRT